ncbi:MAG: hypothetical protein SVR04_18290 [Spirochaetota bacterium]|nr:hypothetical protein [Spirochaetota bacterium]
MTLFPSHSFQLLGLWVPVALYFVPLLAAVLVRRGVFHRTVTFFSTRRSSREYSLFIVSKMIMLGYLLYSFAVPLRSSTWSFRTGAATYLFGYLLYTAAWVNVAAAIKITL